MATKTKKITTEDIVVLPTAKWEEFADQNGEQLDQLNRRLDEEAAHTAKVAAYMGRRQLGQDHDKAMAHAESVNRKVRKALGYTYP